MKTTYGVDATAFLSLPVPTRQLPQPFDMPAPDRIKDGGYVPGIEHASVDARSCVRVGRIEAAIFPLEQGARRNARLLFLPPYSPDLNPIRQVVAKLKHLLRQAPEQSVEATCQRIGALLDPSPPHKCANYLRN